MTTKAMHNDKVGQALHILGEAADEKKQELRQNFTRIAKRTQKIASQQGKRFQKTAVEVDKRLHKNPWAYLAAATAGAVALGFILGKVQGRNQ